MSLNWVEKQKAFQDFVVACTGFTDTKCIWGGQQGFRPTQPTIVLSVMFIDDDGRPWVDTENNTLSITPLNITSVDATANTLTATGHGRSTGDGPFNLVGADLPAGTDEDTNYWLIVVDADTFKVALSFQAAKASTPVPVDLTDTGSGTMTLESNDYTLPVGAEINHIQRSLIKGILTAQCYTSTGVGLDMAQAVLWRINAKRLLPSIVDILETKNIGIIEVGQVRTVGGTQDLVLFEPRAFVDIRFHMTSEETETGGIIERTEITDEEHVNTFIVDGAGP